MKGIYLSFNKDYAACLKYSANYIVT